MLDQEQRATIMELFGSGTSISEIARKVGVSRQTVYRVIETDVEKDPEVRKLEKEVKKAKFLRELDEIRAPKKRDTKLDDTMRVVDALFRRVLYLWYTSPVLRDSSPLCVYCGEKMEYVKRTDELEVVHPGYRCHHCRKVFEFP